MANEYAVKIAELELPTSVVTFASPGTSNANPPSDLAQTIIHFGHTDDPIFEHQGFIGSFLNGLVRDWTSIEIELPNVNSSYHG